MRRAVIAVALALAALAAVAQASVRVERSSLYGGPTDQCSRSGDRLICGRFNLFTGSRGEIEGVSGRWGCSGGRARRTFFGPFAPVRVRRSDGYFSISASIRWGTREDPHPARLRMRGRLTNGPARFGRAKFSITTKDDCSSGWHRAYFSEVVPVPPT